MPDDERGGSARNALNGGYWKSTFNDELSKKRSLAILYTARWLGILPLKAGIVVRKKIEKAFHYHPDDWYSIAIERENACYRDRLCTVIEK